MFRDTLEQGTEYHDSLFRFIHNESVNGHISLKLAAHRSCLRKVAFIALLTSVAAIYISGTSYLSFGDKRMLSLMLAAMLAFTGSLFFYSGLPCAMYDNLSSIKERFLSSSLTRLVESGAPDDIVQELIKRLREQESLSYAEVFDSYWLCSKRAAGTDKGTILVEKYFQIRSRQLVMTRKIL